MQTTSVVGVGCCDRAKPTLTGQGGLGERWQRAVDVSGLLRADDAGEASGDAGDQTMGLARSGCRGQHDGWPGSSDSGLAGDNDEAVGFVGIDVRMTMVPSKFEIGHDRRRMKVESSVTEEMSLLRVATVINVGLRPRWIWDGLDLMVMMDGLDGSTRYSPSVGFDKDDDGVVLTVGRRWADVDG
ncbi:hypothetical protein ACLOJK_014812 [Asimina triloba]